MDKQTILTIKSLYDFENHDVDFFLEYMRKVRNEDSTRMNMTRYTEYITSEMQNSWYKSLNSNISPYIAIVAEHGAAFYPCGYGVITTEQDYCLLTGVIESRYRGMGYGRELFIQLINEAKKLKNRVCLEVLNTNYPAKSLYESLGFVSKKINDNVVFMELEL